MNPAAVPDYVDCDDFDLGGEIYGNEISPGSSTFGTESPSEFGSVSGSSDSSYSSSVSGSSSGSFSSSSSSSEFNFDDDNNSNDDDDDSSFFQGIWNWFKRLFRRN